MTPGILSIDQGTHASRASVYDLAGNPLESVEKTIYLNRVNDTCVEQNPVEILESVKTVFQKICDSIAGKIQLQSIGIATQRSSLVAWNKSGDAISPVLSWQDRRAYKEIQNLKSQEPAIRKKTGLPLSPHYGASKFQWLLKHNQEVKKAALENNLCFGPLVSYLIYNLLNDKPFKVDHANASRTLLWNIETGDWDEDLLRVFSIERSFLPACRVNVSDYGNWKGIPVKAVSGDQNSAIFSEGNPENNLAIVNIGSGAFILKPTDKFIEHKTLLSGISYSDDRAMHYTLEGTVNGAATALDWCKEKIQTSIDIDESIKSVEEPPLFINSVGGFGSPFWKSGENPYWIDKPQTNKAAIAGVAESIVFLLRINLEEIQKAGQKIDLLRVSGGLSQSDALCQKLTDTCRIAVHRLSLTEATSRGIAFLAAGQPEGWSKSPFDVFIPSEEVDVKLEGRYRKFYEIVSTI